MTLNIEEGRYYFSLVCLMVWLHRLFRAIGLDEEWFQIYDQHIQININLLLPCESTCPCRYLLTWLCAKIQCIIDANSLATSTIGMQCNFSLLNIGKSVCFAMLTGYMVRCIALFAVRIVFFACSQWMCNPFLGCTITALLAVMSQHTLLLCLLLQIDMY